MNGKMKKPIKDLIICYFPKSFITLGSGKSNKEKETWGAEKTHPYENCPHFPRYYRNRLARDGYVIKRI